MAELFVLAIVAAVAGNMLKTVRGRPEATINYLESDRLPAKSGVYVVRCKKDILYVGQSVNVRRRWSGLSHHRIYDCWFAVEEKDQKHLCIDFYPVNKKKLLDTEQAFINKLNPRLNKRG